MKFLIGFFVIVFLSAFGNERHAYLESFLTTPFSEAIQNVGALPVYVNFSRKQLNHVFTEFIRDENLNDMAKSLKTWSAEFFLSEDSAAWQNSNYRFGIFGGTEATHKKQRLIHGINCKMCFEYCDWIRENKRGELEKMPYLSRLLDHLTFLDEICQGIFLKQVQEIGKIYPQINQIFVTYKNHQRLPITIRLIRFENAEKFTMPLHFDISLMSLIFPSDDDPLNECLAIAPANGNNFSEDLLRRALRPTPIGSDKSCALLISGTLLSYLNIPILPVPHCVLPHYRDSRCVIVACLHVPNLDTSQQDFVLPTLTEVPKHL